MKINAQKTKEPRISFLSHESPVQPLTADGRVIDNVTHFKLLKVYISSDLTWSHHVDYTCTKASKGLNALRTLKPVDTSSNDLVSVYCSFVRPKSEYARQVWHFAITTSLRDQIEKIQQRAHQIIFPWLFLPGKPGYSQPDYAVWAPRELVPCTIQICSWTYQHAELFTTWKENTSLPSQESKKIPNF